MDGQGTKRRKNITENFNLLVGCTNVTDDRRQTDLRRHNRTWT